MASSRRRKGEAVILEISCVLLLNALPRTGIFTLRTRRITTGGCIYGVFIPPSLLRMHSSATQTLECGSTPITSLDFSEPYGTLVTASQEDAHPRVWDLLSGEEIGRLRGHVGTVKALQVETHLCVTGATDGAVRLWDLRRVDGDVETSEWDLSDVLEEAEEGEGTGTDGGVVVERPRTRPNGIRSTSGAPVEDATGPCVRVLEGHSKAVTALYFESDTLVRVILRYS
jgi:division protein 1